MKISQAFLLMLLSSCNPVKTTTEAQSTPSLTSSPTVKDLTISDQEQRQEIGNYAIIMMKMVETKLSRTAQNVIAKSIVNTSMEIFSSQEERKQFVVLIGIESKFNPKASSASGAVGLTQLIPKYAKEFGSKCGMDDVTREDLDNHDINLLIGACRFKALLDTLNSNVALALVAYNAGQNSNQLKQLKSLNNITNIETSSYIAKYTFLRSKADQHKKETQKDIDKSIPLP